MDKKLVSFMIACRWLAAIFTTPMPKWVVLLVDIVCVGISLGVVQLGTEAFGGVTQPWPYMPWVKVAVCLVFYLLSMLVFRTYVNIVRLSVIEDTYRIVKMVVFATILLLCVVIVTRNATPHQYISYWTVFEIAAFTFTLMLMTRLLIKYFFSVYSHMRRVRQRVVVLGATMPSYMVANALLGEVDGQYMPVALMSLNRQDSDKTVNTLPVIVFDPATVEETFRRLDCDILIFRRAQIEKIRGDVGDVFIRAGIKMLMVNAIEEVDLSAEAAPMSSHVRDIKIEDLLGREPIRNNNPAIVDVIHGQVVMVTGAAGSIGSEIVKQVAQMGAECIVLLDQAETPMHELQLMMRELYPHTHIELCVADITNRHRIETIFRTFQPRYVFHAAAYKHVPMMEINPSEAVQTNVMGTKNLADLSLKYDVDKFVMISTDKAVNPTNIMGASKRIAEIYVQSLFLQARATRDGHYTRFITTRFGNVLGSNGSVIPLFRSQIEKGGPVTVTHHDIIRYFMTIPEACSLVLEAGSMGSGGEIYIFDMGQPVRIYDLAVKMIALSGLRPDIDIKIVETGLRPGEKLYEELLNDREKTITTNHHKIMIARVRQYPYQEVENHLKRLADFLLADDIHALVTEMKNLVPEFVSNNSQFEAIDHEIEHRTGLHEVK